MIIMLQPSAGTWARFVHNPGEPPSLMIQDGTSILVLRPADLGGGLVAAAEFAEALIQAVSEWESGCRRTLAATPTTGSPEIPSVRHTGRMASVAAHGGSTMRNTTAG